MFYFRCRYQYLSKLLTFCVLLGFAVVCGCSESENRNELAPSITETPHAISKEMMAEVLASVEKKMFAAEMEFASQFAVAPMAPMLQRLPTLAETMAELHMEFPGNVLDEGFTRIREIIESETYVEFLKRTYPQDNQFQNFDEFWNLASVDKERYLEFLNAYFKPPLPEPAAEDIDVLHYMTLFQRHLNVRTYHGEDQGREGTMDMLMNEPVHPWLEKRFVNTNGKVNVLLLLRLLVHHSVWIKELQEEDREKIQAFFLEHKVQKGFLRFALEDPVSLGHLLKDFTDVKVFKKWIDGEFSKNAAWWLGPQDNAEK